MKNILSKLWLCFTVLVLIILLIIWLFQIGLLNQFYIREREDILTKEAKKLSSIIVDSEGSNPASNEVIEEIQRFGTSVHALILVLDKENNVVLDVPDIDRYLINGNETNKIDKRLSTGILADEMIISYINEGRSFTIHRKRPHPRGLEASIIVGVPIVDGEKVLGNVIISSPLYPIEETITILKKQLSIISILSLAIGTILALSFAKFFTKPIMKIIGASKEIAKGNFAVRVNHQSNDEIGTLGETINDMAKQLSKIEALRREFIANISHELKTPLSLIKAYAELVKDMNSFSTKDKEQYLQVIIDESDRLNHMIEDILYLSKMESEHMDLTYEKISLEELLDCIIDNLVFFAENRDVKIMIVAKSKEDIIYADKDKMYQVFYNIINNAINHSYENGKIQIKIFDTDNKIRVEVIDDGKGISEKDLPYIWDRFYKVEKSRKRDNNSGTGLGMSIVKNILEAHDFKYGVESQLNKGTKVWVEIGLKEASNKIYCSEK
ncbi:Signal transduction histidine kinase [Anaerovirgula multivorans]|uniref:histidine kinase n=1 Tax=Anaerovirgula multivorans TaxID=312168 RepID=A0A239FVL6_9FIRM|nr:GAF domain-containing sensor histidine kinase [Anaerovirgula multivorans]SNS61037.1 Signal transduction histidine kinase [Anaerovirgula multivorans]